jgi:zinc transport system ATP-binding protein
MPKPLILIENINKSYNNRKVLENVSLAIHKGEISTLIGPNGAGKTTLVKTVLGLITPDSGQVERDRDLRIGYMPQQVFIDPTLPITLYRFLQLACNQKSTIKNAMGKVGIDHLENSQLQHLSGGEMQRALLARALLRKPNLLVLDEPVQGVDLTGQEALYQLIGQIRDELNCGVLMVSHDLHLVMAATDNVICLNRHICCHGNPQQVTNNSEFKALFGEKVAFYDHNHDHDHDMHGNIESSTPHQCGEDHA